MFINKETIERAKQYLRKVPGLMLFYGTLKLIKSLHKTGNFRFVYRIKPGDYYSPLPDYKATLARSEILFKQDEAKCLGIDLKEEAQLKLLENFAEYYGNIPFSIQPGENTRYYENTWFNYADAIILYSVMRHYEPARVIEVGSGFSSAAMLDVNDLFLQNTVDFTFIEPDPQRLFSLLKPEDKNRHTVVPNEVQDVPLAVFRTSNVNDILFVDSSHVVKVGSDVAHILFNVLPNLNPGVIVHFHDIFWPFEYPKDWITLGRAWNESYFLRSFLQYNDAFEILFFNSFVAKRHPDLLREKMPMYLREVRADHRHIYPDEQHRSLLVSRPCSLWLKKVI